MMMMKFRGGVTVHTGSFRGCLPKICDAGMSSVGLIGKDTTARRGRAARRISSSGAISGAGSSRLRRILILILIDQYQYQYQLRRSSGIRKVNPSKPNYLLLEYTDTDPDTLETRFQHPKMSLAFLATATLSLVQRPPPLRSGNASEKCFRETLLI